MTAEPPAPDQDLACVEEVEIITHYLEQALPAPERRRLEAHLATCPGCTEYVAQMRAIAGSLGGLDDEAAIAARTREALLAAFREMRN